MGSSYRPSFSCIRCAERKVKCNRAQPCRACFNHRVECIYRIVKGVDDRESSAVHQALKRRVQAYERLLHSKGIEPSLPPESVAATKGTDFNLNPGRTAGEQHASRVEGRHGFIDNSLFTRVVEEVDRVEYDHDDLDVESDREDDNESILVFERLQLRRSIVKEFSSSQMLALWRTFKTNVDPLTKVVHVPSLEPLIEQAAQRWAAIAKPYRALLLAIYSAAVMSMNEKECGDLLGRSQETALQALVHDTMKALCAAHFMRSSNLIILQAMILYILSVRDSQDARTIFNLTGIAIRMAQGLGLQHNGEDIGLSPFESELRRRIWWFLKMHDARAAELCGMAKFSGFANELRGLKTLVNCDDSQMKPGIETLPKDKTGTSDMMFCALKVDFAACFVSLPDTKRGEKFDASYSADDYLNDTNLQMKLELNRRLLRIYETKYAPFCDPLDPLHLFSMLFMRYSTGVGEFFTHHPRKWRDPSQISKAAKSQIYNICVRLLEHFHMLQTSPHLQRFAWYMCYYLQWHSLIYVLDVLSASPDTDSADKVWQLIEGIYMCEKQTIMDIRRPINLAVAGLCLKAFAAREAALHMVGNDIKTPQFITEIRQRLEETRIRRRMRKQGRESASDTLVEDPTTAQLHEQGQISKTDSNDSYVRQALLDADGSCGDDTFNELFDPDFWLSSNDEMGRDIDWMQWDSLLRI